MAIPTRLIISIGGFGGPQHDVRWHRGKLRYRSHEAPSEVPIVPSGVDWESFWTAMDRIGVWNWQARYNDRETLDGTQWSIDISKGSRSVRCFGSNAYPGGKDLQHARPFQEFLAAVRALVRQPFGR